MRRTALVAAALLSCALAGARPARAFALPEQPTGPLNDYAQALSMEARSRLDAQLRNYSQGTTLQIAVAVFKSLDGESLEDVSIRLAEKWKIGGKKTNDGVLLTLFLDDHKLRIEVGYGLEGKLPDALCGRIIRDVMAPRLRAGDLEGALRSGIAAIDQAATGRTHAEGSAPPPRHSSPSTEVPPWVILLFLVGYLTVWWLTRRRRFFIGGGGGWSSGGSSSWGGGSWGGGGGGWSGGGGSFGGGGSSGSW